MREVCLSAALKFNQMECHLSNAKQVDVMYITCIPESLALAALAGLHACKLWMTCTVCKLTLSLSLSLSQSLFAIFPRG